MRSFCSIARHAGITEAKRSSSEGMENKSITVLKGELSKAQADFLKFCSDVRYGTLEVEIKDGQPVMSKVIEQWHKHD